MLKIKTNRDGFAYYETCASVGNLVCFCLLIGSEIEIDLPSGAVLYRKLHDSSVVYMDPSEKYHER